MFFILVTFFDALASKEMENRELHCKLETCKWQVQSPNDTACAFHVTEINVLHVNKWEYQMEILAFSSRAASQLFSPLIYTSLKTTV